MRGPFQNTILLNLQMLRQMNLIKTLIVNIIICMTSGLLNGDTLRWPFKDKMLF